MLYEHNTVKPEHISENWPGKWKIFSWMEFVCAIPHVMFLVTTMKDNGQANVGFQSWSHFTGEGNDYFVIMSGLMKHTHTYQNISREKEFCINFVGEDYLEHCWRSIHEHDYDTDEILASGLTAEPSATIQAPRITESFLKMECEYVWEKELLENSTNMTICGKLKYLSVDDAFVQAATSKKYTDNTFMFNLHNPINPRTGEHLGGGVGSIKYIHKM